MSIPNSSIQQTEFIACQQCGADHFHRLFTTWDMWDNADPTTKERYTFVQCKNCKLVYLNPRIPAKDIGQYYQDDYLSYAKRPDLVPSEGLTGLKGYLRPKIRQARLNLFKKLLSPSQIKPKLDWLELSLFRSAPFIFPGNGFKMLDVGCGTGQDLMARQELGWDVYGLEPSPNAVRICQNYGLNVQQGLLIDNVWDENMFDVVTLNQVVEHFEELQENLGQIYRLLKPGGLVYMSTPNWDSLPARLFKTYWIGADTPRHYFLFTPKTLAQALTKVNLIPKYWYTQSSVSEYTATIEFVLREKFGTKIKRDAIRKNKCLSYLFLPLAYSNAWLNIGGSIHMFAQKPTV